MNTDTTVNLEQWDRLVSEHRALREALETIHTGQTMQGRTAWTHADIIQEHYAICRAALAAVKGNTK